MPFPQNRLRGYGPLNPLRTRQAAVYLAFAKVGTHFPDQVVVGAVMAEPAVKTVDADEDTAAGPTIDRDHLARMTFGDSSLERELLTLFDRQSVLLLERIEKADATTRAALAHTLKGSALSIGAVGVARAAAALEQTGGGPAIDRLTVAVVAARTTIATLLCDS